MEKADIEFLQKVMEKISQSAFEFGNTIVPILQRFRDEMNGYYRIIYPLLRKEYEMAGAPYGADDEGMWKWLHGKAQSTACKENPMSGENWVMDIIKLQEYMRERVN